ncbi:MAG: hypothetical protein QOJ51_1356 [Acidobacteriaceae bacterium]|jgi:hypothetical protein|nr:hypothetical protein [Acidobacteriaceae bacterium]MEA2258531.1 hypothetical protein [Acidobacteriaceae bacterium]
MDRWVDLGLLMVIFIAALFCDVPWADTEDEPQSARSSWARNIWPLRLSNVLIVSGFLYGVWWSGPGTR